MSKKKALVISLILLCVAITFMVMSYFMFHYLTNDGFVSSKRETPGKPVVTYSFILFSILNYFGSLVFLLIAVVNPKD